MKTRRKQVLVMLIFLYILLCIGFDQQLIKGFGTYDNVQGTIVNYEPLGQQYSVFSNMDIRVSKNNDLHQ